MGGSIRYTLRYTKKSDISAFDKFSIRYSTPCSYWGKGGLLHQQGLPVGNSSLPLFFRKTQVSVKNEFRTKNTQKSTKNSSFSLNNCYPLFIWLLFFQQNQTFSMFMHVVAVLCNFLGKQCLWQYCNPFCVWPHI